MKKFLLFAFILFNALIVSAQEKVKDVVDDDYVRNSLSVIVVTRGDNFDANVINGVKSIDFGDKFDINSIPTDRLMIKSARKGSVDVDLITASLSREGVGKEIVSYWYRRDANGNMGDELILQRGMYSVDDQEILNAQVSKVGASALGEKGYDLVKGSYVFVLDYYNMRKENDTYHADVNGVIYQLDYSEELLEQVYEAWIYEDDTPEVRANKNKLFDSLEFPLKYITMVNASASSSSSYGDAVRSAYNTAFYRSEKAVDQWNVTSSVISTRPIKAKIGTKEGLKNGQRFRVYKIVEDRSGEIDSRPVGYVRATEVVNNSRVATGDMDASSFYQIAGFGIDEGMILKQKNDLKMGVTVSGVIGGYSPFEIGFEYLEHINTKGTSRYVMLNLGFDAVSSSVIGQSVSYVVVGLGYGVAVRPVRPVEIMPFIQFGCDVLSDGSSSSSSSSTNKKSGEWISWLAKAGARLSWQVVYPVQIFAQVDAAARFAEGTKYKECNDVLLMLGYGHKNGLVGFSFGAKVSF